MRLLVSGVASDIGLGVGRVFEKWGFFDRINGIDISDDHPASIVFDQVDIAPQAEDPNYIDWLSEYITLNKIDLFIPTSEAEINVVSNQLVYLKKFCKVLINEQIIVEHCLDKYKTLNFLSANGINVPLNGLVGEGSQPVNYPIITKPRRGQGSKGIQKVYSSLDLETCPKEYVWQEYLMPDKEEYTCAIYVTKSLYVRILVLKRELIGGYTGKAVVVSNPIINDYLTDIVKIFNKPGLFNIQLRLTKEGPKLFEINPRVSSTVVFRDKLGFQDLRWWVMEILNISLPQYIPVPAGIKIYRGNYEYILETKRAD